MSYYDNRITVVPKTPNPIFEKFLLEFIEEATALDEQELLRNALSSLKKFPILLRSGKDCIILEHFDSHLCKRLDQKLSIHNQKSSEILPASCNDNSNSNSQSQDGGKNKEYTPNYRSAAYALVITLYDKENQPNYKGFMTKIELQTEAQSLADTSLKKPMMGTRYSGWSSMSQLISKGFITKASKPAKFSLTNTGKELAERLKNISHPQSQEVIHVEDLIAPSSRVKKRLIEVEEDEEKEEEEARVEERFALSDFQIVLLVDTAETGRADDCITKQLKELRVNHEVRHLNVGDYLWVARDHNGRELVLPYIVERKRTDDLLSSIKDGRFHEQKFRLKQCGLQVIYLVEEYKCPSLNLPMSTIVQAAINTMVANKFNMRMTEDYKDSMLYLKIITVVLTEMFKDKILNSCSKEEWENNSQSDLKNQSVSLLSFETFSHGMSKTRKYTVKEMFIKQLIQLHGVSADKALAIAGKYPTPISMMRGFSSSGPEMLSNIEYGLLKRKLGPVISRVLHTFYTSRNFEG